MAFVSISPSVHVGRLSATASPFTAAVPGEHPGLLQKVSIDEGFQTGRFQIPPREAVATIEIDDDRADYETRRIQSGDFVVIQDSDNGEAPVARFRGRAYTPRISDTRPGRIRIRIVAHGLWQRFIGLPEVSVASIQDANGKQAVDSVLDQAQWPTSFRNVPTPPNGTNAEYQEWAFDGKPRAGVAAALSGINPRSKHFVDAPGKFCVAWLSRDLQHFTQQEVLPGLGFGYSDIHVINQVLAPAVDVSRVTTTRWTSTTAFDLTDDEDTVVYQDVLTGGADNATWAFRLRQPNGTYFSVHSDVVANLTASYIRGTAALFNIVLTARAKSGDYTTAVNFFQIADTVVTQAQSADPPEVFNLRNVAADEPRTFELPALAYAADVPSTLANNYLTLWGNPFEFVGFSSEMSDDALADKIRDLSLWQRVSVFDGNETHYGFVARKQIEYDAIAPGVPRSRITMMEDFTEGGDISVPFRAPFEWVFNSLAALDMFFERASVLSNRGAWQDEPSGSTPNSSAGPTGNNALAFCHTETSGGNRAAHEDNGALTLDDDVFSVVRNRDVVFRYAAYGDFVAGDGLEVQGRTVQASTIYDLFALDLTPTPDIVRRINVATLGDTTAPYGSLGSGPAGLNGAANFSDAGMALAPNGDIFVIEGNRDFWRLNPNDLDDETGDYGLVGRAYLPSSLSPDAMVVTSGGEVVVIANNNIYYVDSSNPSNETGIYQQIAFGAGNAAGAAAIDSQDRVYVFTAVAGDTRVRRIELADTSPAFTDIADLGTIFPRAGATFDQNGDILTITNAGAITRYNPADFTDTAGVYGDVGNAPAGAYQSLALTTREVRNEGAWTNIATLPASTYPAGNLSAGDTDTDVEGDDYTVAADGGWRDVTVSIPNTYDEIRLRPNLNAGGTEDRQDIALRSMSSPGPATPTPPTPPVTPSAFNWRFDTLAAFETYFTIPQGSDSGHWEADTDAGSTGTGNTGPGTNNADDFVFAKASPGSTVNSTREANGIAEVASGSVATLIDRDIIIRYIAAGRFGDGTGGGISVEGRTTGGAWTEIAFLHGWAYAATRAAGDTVTDNDGVVFDVAQDGGWRDATVSVPDTYDEIRLAPTYTATGQRARQDIALHSIANA